VESKKKREASERQEADRLKVYNVLISESALDDVVHEGIIVTEVTEGDALGAWKILLRKYERNTAVSRNPLRRDEVRCLIQIQGWDHRRIVGGEYGGRRQLAEIAKHFIKTWNPFHREIDSDTINSDNSEFHFFGDNSLED